MMWWLMIIQRFPLRSLCAWKLCETYVHYEDFSFLHCCWKIWRIFCVDLMFQKVQLWPESQATVENICMNLLFINTRCVAFEMTWKVMIALQFWCSFIFASVFFNLLSDLCFSFIYSSLFLCFSVISRFSFSLAWLNDT